MKTETVGYRFSRAELSAFMHMLGMRELPGVDLQPGGPEFETAVKGLIAAGVITPGEGSFYLDRITALLFSALRSQSLYLRIASRDRVSVLSHAPMMCLLADYPARGNCTLTPLQSAAETGEPLADALNRHEMPVTLELVAGGKPAQRFTADQPEQAAERLAALHAAFLQAPQNTFER